MKKIIGYGTFIIKSGQGDERFRKIGVAEIKEFHRLYHPKLRSVLGYWYPFAIQRQNSHFKALVFEVSDEDLASLDEYEGVPSLFQRVTCRITIDGKEDEAEIYIASEYTKQRLKEEIEEFFTDEEKQDLFKRDFWLENLKNHHDYLKEMYPELFE
ncbi:MAG: gamma-glutamylcyclotransferase family protein [Candidatus Helarchaeota archaeon]